MKTCIKCGVSKTLDQFFVRSDSGRHRNECRACERAYKKQWDGANPDRVARYNKKWANEKRDDYLASTRRAGANFRRRHPEKVKTAYADWYAANPDKAKAATDRWLKANPARARQIGRNRDRAQREATPGWLTAIHWAQIEEQYEIAVARTVQTGVMHHVDHVHPLRGKNFRGLHVPWNLQVLTAIDNIRKKNYLVEVL